MTEIQRKAGALWSGDLESGGGVVSTESQALFEAPYSFQTRFGTAVGVNPEELIAAAHAACFSMALAGILKKNGYDPQKTDTNATCTMVSKNGGYEITNIRLHVRGEVPGLDEATFRKLAAEADKECPVSNVLRKGVDIKIDVTLDYT